jgi:hypothetical protein
MPLPPGDQLGGLLLISSTGLLLLLLLLLRGHDRHLHRLQRLPARTPLCRFLRFDSPSFCPAGSAPGLDLLTTLVGGASAAAAPTTSFTTTEFTAGRIC